MNLYRSLTFWAAPSANLIHFTVLRRKRGDWRACWEPFVFTFFWKFVFSAQLMSTHSTLGFTSSFHWAVPCFILIHSIHVILWGHKYWFPRGFSLWHLSLYCVSATENNHYHILWNDRLVLIAHFTSILRFLKHPWILDVRNFSQQLSISDILLCRKTQSMAGTLMIMTLFPCEDTQLHWV